MEEKIKMVSAATRVLSFRKKYPLAIDEEVFQDLMDYISHSGVSDEKIKIYMIASASRAFDISRKNPRLSEKQILSLIVKEIPDILSEIALEEERLKTYQKLQ